MSLHPFFVGKHNDRIVFGTDVWMMYQTGLCSDKIEFNAIREWIFYSYCLGDRFLFYSLSRLPFGTTSIFHYDRYTEISYTNFKPQTYNTSAEEVAENIHAIVTSNVKTLLKSYPPNKFGSVRWL